MAWVHWVGCGIHGALQIVSKGVGFYPKSSDCLLKYFIWETSFLPPGCIPKAESLWRRGRQREVGILVWFQVKKTE